MFHLPIFCLLLHHCLRRGQQPVVHGGRPLSGMLLQFIIKKLYPPLLPCLCIFCRFAVPWALAMYYTIGASGSFILLGPVRRAAFCHFCKTYQNRNLVMAFYWFTAGVSLSCKISLNHLWAAAVARLSPNGNFPVLPH